jgi:hypothetical protein
MLCVDQTHPDCFSLDDMAPVPDRNPLGGEFVMLLMALAAVVLTAAPGRPAVDDASFRSIVLAAHDRERREVGSPPLVWDEGLARDAADWGARLARTRTFEHCSSAGCPTSDQGENLWMGSRGAYSLQSMLQGWSEEKKLLARMDSWEDDHGAVGHYTQMVWHSTTRIGCAVTSNRSDEFLTCRYMRPGNVLGSSPFGSRSGISEAGDDLRPGDVLRRDADGVEYIDGGEEDPADGAIDEGYRDDPDGGRTVTTVSPDGTTTVVTTTVTTE